MDLQLPQDVTAQLDRFDDLLKRLESKLQPFQGPQAQAMIEQLEPLQRAQAQLALAAAAHRALQLLLRASGVDPEGHESRKEQARLDLYTKKVRKAAAERELSQSRRSLEVNVAAVNRFISAAVPDLSAGQKAALKQAGQRAADGGGGGGGGGKRKAGSGAAGGEDEGAAGAAEAFLQETMGELQQPSAGAGGGGSSGKRPRGGR